MSMTSSENPRVGRIWDVFCRVVDNHGDAGVCWRLAANLASRGISVRLWVDDARALAWMAPGGRTGIDVLPWPSTDRDVSTHTANAAAEVVVEAFGCGLPEPYLRCLAVQQSSLASIWINLEYLTAERFAERNHRLPSPQHSGPARGLTSWFFYPGFTADTGGLLREKELLSRQAAFDRDAWLAEHSISPTPGERLVSLFCYENENVPRLLHSLAERPTLLLTTPGHATRQVKRALEDAGIFDRLRVQALPWLTQTDYDHLLWSCDVNFVRGEDSLVRAIWAGRPFVWQIYPQDAAAHHAKLAAFFARKLANVEPACAAQIRGLGWLWNDVADAGDGNWNILNSPLAMSIWAARCVSWRDELLGQPDLTSQLLAFAATQGAREDAKI